MDGRPARRRTPLRHRRRWVGFAFVSAVVLTLAAAGWSYLRFLARRGPQGAAVAVTIPTGTDAGQLAELLARNGATDRPGWLRVHLTLTRTPTCVVAGPHLLPPSTPRELVALLCRTDARPVTRLTIPEGSHRFAIATRLATAGVVARDEFLRASSRRDLLDGLGIEAPNLPDPSLKAAMDSAEGFLFPATYALHLDSDPDEIIRHLVREADRRWKSALGTHGTTEIAREWSRRAVVTLASMVEKEAVVAEERPIIASVFLNRLRDPEFRRLQSDPTGIYGCIAFPERIAACAGFNGKATPALLRDPANVYSTYVVDGLPAAPIANPGEASIAAVLNPADTKFRYFVARGGGRHAFSETYEQHLEAVKRLREARE